MNLFSIRFYYIILLNISEFKFVYTLFESHSCGCDRVLYIPAPDD